MDSPAFRCSAEVYDAFRRRLERSKCEVFYVVALDSRNRAIRWHLVAKGGVNHLAMVPADVFRPLFRDNAAAFIALHNHPSGDPAPSPEDQDVTLRFGSCGRLLGVPLLDHLIVGRDGYYSFRDAGRMLLDVPEPEPLRTAAGG